MTLRAFVTVAVLATANVHAATTVLYVQPSVGSVSSILNGTPIPDVATIRTFDVGTVSQIPFWNVSSFTGLSTPVGESANWERTVDSTWNGSTAVQAYQNSVGFQLHTYSSPVVSGRPLKTINLHLDFSESKFVRPWGGQYGQNAKLCMGFYAAVPSSWSGDGSTNSSGANFTFRDVSSGRTFTVGVMLYSSGNILDFVGYDGGQGGTNMPMVGSYYGAQQYITTTPGSGFARQSTWNNDTWFGFCMTPQNINTVVAAVNASLPAGQPLFTAANLGLGTSIIGTEIFTGDTGTSNGHMAARFREWAILIEH
jgi:hypothetical protein